VEENGSRRLGTAVGKEKAKSRTRYADCIDYCNYPVSICNNMDVIAVSKARIAMDVVIQ
jgi:hypothetical protein